MKTAFLLGLFAPTLVFATAFATTALANDKAICLSAASKGQRLRATHKLVEARDQLRVCAAARCPKVVQRDCANWLAEVEDALPSVVVTAKTGRGADLVDVKVSVDGEPFVSKLDGQAIPMNAGSHSFHFETPDGTTLDQQVLLKEGEKNQSVAVVLGPIPPPPSARSAPSNGSESAPVSSDSGGTSHAGKTAGWVLAASGVAGLGVGGAFGVIALGDKNSAHCNPSGVCDPGTVSGIKTAALVSDIGWIAGGVLMATGLALILFSPNGSGGHAASVRVVPVVTANGGGIAAGGSW